jgi:hypothetical protein
MNHAFIRYLKQKVKKKELLFLAQLNMAKQSQ